MMKLPTTDTAVYIGVCDAGAVCVWLCVCLGALVEQSGARYHTKYEPDMTCD